MNVTPVRGNTDTLWKHKWHEGGKAGYEVWNEEGAMGSPIARVFTRSLTMERGGRAKAAVYDRTGTQRIELDDEAMKNIEDGGISESRKCLRAALAVHILERFTHCVATDGSKAHGKVGYGLWWGLNGAGPGDATVRDPVYDVVFGQGIICGRLPDSWEVANAEMYAVPIAVL